VRWTLVGRHGTFGPDDASRFALESTSETKGSPVGIMGSGAPETSQTCLHSRPVSVGYGPPSSRSSRVRLRRITACGSREDSAAPRDMVEGCAGAWGGAEPSTPTSFMSAARPHPARPRAPLGMTYGDRGSPACPQEVAVGPRPGHQRRPQLARLRHEGAPAEHGATPSGYAPQWYLHSPSSLARPGPQGVPAPHAARSRGRAPMATPNAAKDRPRSVRRPCNRGGQLHLEPIGGRLETPHSSRRPRRCSRLRTCERR